MVSQKFSCMLIFSYSIFLLSFPNPYVFLCLLSFHILFSILYSSIIFSFVHYCYFSLFLCWFCYYWVLFCLDLFFQHLFNNMNDVRLSLKISHTDSWFYPLMPHCTQDPIPTGRCIKPTQGTFVEHPVQEAKETVPLGPTEHLIQKATQQIWES